MKTLLTRLKNRLFKRAQSLPKPQHIDYQLQHSVNAMSIIKRGPQQAHGALSNLQTKAHKVPKNLRAENTVKPFGYLNRYGQIVKKKELSTAPHRHHRHRYANEANLRQLIQHSMVCNGLLSQNYQIDLDAEDEQHAAYNVIMNVPADFSFSEQRRILVEELIYATAHEKLTVDVASIVWRNC